MKWSIFSLTFTQWFSIWLIFCLSSCYYSYNVLQYWTALLWHSTVYSSTSWQISVYVVKIYILLAYFNVLETELIFPLTTFPLSKFLFARSTLGWILVAMEEHANGNGSCKSISGSPILYTMWKMIWLILCWWFSFLFLHFMKCGVDKYR